MCIFTDIHNNEQINGGEEKKFYQITPTSFQSMPRTSVKFSKKQDSAAFNSPHCSHFPCSYSSNLGKDETTPSEGPIQCIKHTCDVRLTLPEMVFVVNSQRLGRAESTQDFDSKYASHPCLHRNLSWKDKDSHGSGTFLVGLYIGTATLEVNFVNINPCGGHCTSVSTTTSPLSQLQCRCRDQELLCGFKSRICLELKPLTVMGPVIMLCCPHRTAERL